MQAVIDSLFDVGDLVIPKRSVLKDTVCKVLKVEWANGLREFQYFVLASEAFPVWYSEKDLMSATEARIKEIERLYAEYGD